MHRSRNSNHRANAEATEISYNHWDEYSKSSENFNGKNILELASEGFLFGMIINVCEHNELLNML